MCREGFRTPPAVTASRPGRNGHRLPRRGIRRLFSSLSSARTARGPPEKATSRRTEERLGYAHDKNSATVHLRLGPRRRDSQPPDRPQTGLVDRALTPSRETLTRSLRRRRDLDGIPTPVPLLARDAAVCARTHVMAQTADRRPPLPQRHPRGDVAAEVARPADLRQRPAVLGRLRDPGDPADPLDRRPGLPRAGSVDRAGGRGAAHRRRHLLPPGGARLSQRGRLVRGHRAQPRPLGGAGRSRGADGRLHHDRGRVGLLRRGQHHLRRPTAERPPAPARRRLHRGADGDEPARPARIRPRFRRPHLPVHRFRPARDRHRLRPGAGRAPPRSPKAPATTSAPNRPG